MLSNFYWYLKIKLALHLSVQRVGKFRTKKLNYHKKFASVSPQNIENPNFFNVSLLPQFMYKFRGFDGSESWKYSTANKLSLQYAFWKTKLQCFVSKTLQK